MYREPLWGMPLVYTVVYYAKYLYFKTDDDDGMFRV